MTAQERAIVEFFLTMQQHMTLADAPAIRAMFASESLEANPARMRVRRQDEEFADAIEEWLDYLRLAGMRDVEALQIDATLLGAGYALVQVRWSVWFMPAGRPDFVEEFRFDYLVQQRGEGMAIVVSIAHDDEAAMMRRLQLAV